MGIAEPELGAADRACRPPRTFPPHGQLDHWTVERPSDLVVIRFGAHRMGSTTDEARARGHGRRLVGPVAHPVGTSRLFNPALVTAVTDATGGTGLDVTGIVIGCVVVAVVVWDAIDGFLKARRAGQARRAAPAAEVGPLR